ncbi:MAG: hypothetical protein QOG62_2792 [Thermoleophilaceae bacterium]|nr:hypothetical protein [Thermoleophilaceae bacterium]
MGGRVSIAQALEDKRRPAGDVLSLVKNGDDLIVGLGNGEPFTILDVVEAAADSLSDVRIHQMLPLRERPSMHGGAGIRSAPGA